jgi:hypothetical protein
VPFFAFIQNFDDSRLRLQRLPTLDEIAAKLQSQSSAGGSICRI